MSIELLEQRRKFGFIRKLDEKFNVISSLDALDLEYLSLIIEMCFLFDNHKLDLFNNLTNIVLVLEDYLTRVVEVNDTLEINIKLEDIKNFDASSSKLSKHKIGWIKENIGAISSRTLNC